MNRLRGRVERDDSGAALLIALGFIVLFGLAIMSVLSFTDTSLKASASVQSSREDVYAADGAVETAIAAMRYDLAKGKEVGGSSCGASVPGLNSRTVTVTCSPQTGSGSGGGGTALGTAIFTTSTSANEPGIFRPSSDTLRVTGHVVSNSNMNGGSNAKMEVAGNAYARTGCLAGMVTATGTVNCSLGAGNSAFNLDVKAADITVPPAAKTPPACVPSTVIALDPGTYTDATKLNSLTSGLCANALVWLKPGVFYFNFANAGTHEWLIGDKSVNVVAGERNGFPASGVRPLTPLPFPGACKTSSDPAPNSGSQLVFAGDSRMYVLAGQAELCSPTGGNEIAVYGTGDGTQTSASGTQTATGATATNFSPASGAQTIGDASAATVSLASGGLKNGQVVLTGFNQTTVPAGATMTAASMQIASAVTGDINATSNTQITMTKPATGGTCTFTPAASVDLMQKCGITNPGDVTGTTVTYDVVLPSGAKKAGTASLDGVAISVTWLTAGLAPESGCITADGYSTPGGDAAHCAVLKTDGNFGNLAIRGAVYAPRAPLDINLTNAATQLFNRGIVGRVAYISVTPASGFTGSVITTPGGSDPLQPREVLLVAQVDGRDRLRALVHFDDGVNGATPGQTVTVKRWDVVR